MYSDDLEHLTGTFSADRRYCDALVAAHADRIARLLVYRRWAAAFALQMQEDLNRAVPTHFDKSVRHDAGFWTLALTASIHRDIALIPYLSIRGLGTDAGIVVRRSVEHAGILAHLWKVPENAFFLRDPESGGFKTAFVSETNGQKARKLKQAGIQKRFEHCYNAEAASSLYRLLSAYTIHGGSPKQLANVAQEPTGFDCMFLIRPNPSGAEVGRALEVVGHAAEILCTELCALIRLVAKEYRLASARSGEGVRMMAEILDSSTNRLRELVRSTKQDLNWP